MIWKLKHTPLEGDVTEQTFEEWGFEKLHRTTQNQFSTEVSFDQLGVNFDDDFDMVEGDTITIYRQNEENEWVQWFVGVLRDPERFAREGQEGVTWIADGLEKYFEELVFRQPWYFRTDFNDPESDLEVVMMAELILFQKIVGGASAFATVGEQIEAIVEYLISKLGEDKLQFDATGLPTHEAPFIYVENETCASCLSYCQRTCPDLTFWIDYSTTPPTFKGGRRADLSAASLTIYPPGEAPITSPITKISPIVARNNLKVPAVWLQYKQVNQINGYSIPFVSNDIANPDDVDLTGFKVLPHSINLQGANVTYPVETLVVETIDRFSVSWWKSHVPELADALEPGQTSTTFKKIRNLRIRDATRTGFLPRMLMPSSGAWSPWMGGQAEEDTIQCYASYEVWDQKTGPGGIIAQVQREVVYDELIPLKVMTTNLASGVYQGAISEGSTLGEPVPTGLAQALLEAANELHFEGKIELTEDECSGLVKVGQVLNITGSRAEFSSMRAMVQEVSENVDDGITVVTFGPPKHLGAEDFMDWLRGLRNRYPQTSWQTRVNGLRPGGGALTMASRAPKEALSGRTSARERMMLYRPDSGATQTEDTLTAKIILDILDAAGKEIKIREVQVSKQINGACVSGKMYMLCSEFIPNA